MTEPTWKDPLLREWKPSEETLAYLGRAYGPASPIAHPVAVLVAMSFGSSATVMLDGVRLRSLIDAELARGREAVEVLTKHQWAGMMGAVCRECDHGSTRGHAPDCRLAKVIGQQTKQSPLEP